MKKYLVIIPLLFIALSCESSQIIEPDISFQEYIVVNGELDRLEIFRGVTFTKSLPIGVPYDIKTAELKDVKAYLKINGTKVVPLHYAGNGLYKPLYPELRPVGGETFELFAEYGENIIYGKTIIPFDPLINTVSMNTVNNTMHANIASRDDEVYGAIWIIGSGSDKAITFPNLSIPKPGSLDINVVTLGMPKEYNSSSYNGRRNIQVFSYDKQYADYFNSVKSSVPIGDAFMQHGGTTGWNVFGKNVIGIFIGVSKGLKKNVN